MSGVRCGVQAGSCYWPVTCPVIGRATPIIGLPVTGRRTGRGRERVAGVLSYWTGVQRVRVALDTRPRYWDSRVGGA